MEYILQTYALTKRYGRYNAVDGVDMHVKQGDIYAFIGRNGAGKTTMLKMISGMASSTSGELEIYGKKGGELDSVRNKIGCLIEAPGLYPNLTAYANLKIKCLAAGVNPDKCIGNILELVGLANVKKKKVKNYSLGMKQRLGIGMALVGDPEILVLDEPINGLDPQGIAEVRSLIKKLNSERNITIIISSHILEELSKIATVYGIINNGSLMCELNEAELLERGKERLVFNFEQPQLAVPILNSMGYTKYTITAPNTIEIYERLDSIPDIIASLSAQGVRILSAYKKADAIEQYFLELTGGKTNG